MQPPSTQAKQQTPVPPPPGINTKQVLKKQQIVGAHPPDTWIALFQHLIYKAEQHQRRMGWGCLVTGILILLCIGSFIGLESLGVSPTLSISIALSLLLITIICIVALQIYSRGNANLVAMMQYMLFLLPILQVLRAEMRPTEPLHLWIDTRGWKLDSKKVNRIDHRDDKKTIDTIYLDRWLVGGACLADRSRLKFQCTNRVRSRDTTFKRTGGRVKTKTKEKTKTTVDVRLKVSNRRYPKVQRDPQQEATYGIRIIPQERRTEIRVRQKHRVNLEDKARAPFLRPFTYAVGAAYRPIEVRDTGASTRERSRWL